jgi:predicted dienelactone hydrolase
MLAAMRACLPWLGVLSSFVLLGCGSSAETRDAGVRDATVDAGVDSGPAIEPRADYGEPGPYPVGHRRVVMVDRTGERALPVELWYPADDAARDEATRGRPMEAFEAGTANEATLASLIADAPASCIRARTQAADAPPAASTEGALPLVVFSHCHACTRFSSAALAERLASHGVVVAAPDHVGNTLWDSLAGEVAPVGDAFLRVRASDVSSVLDRLLSPDAEEVPADLRGRLDPARVAMMGHSYGAATTGLVANTDDRFVAAVAIAAPIAAFGGVSLAEVDIPYLFLVAREDNSIGELGNIVIRGEHEELATSWRVEVDDAGHWSFSDVPGLVPMFAAGCGDGVRQTMPGEPFTYLDASVARELAADAAMSFFAIHLLDDPGGATTLVRLRQRAGVAVDGP